MVHNNYPTIVCPMFSSSLFSHLSCNSIFNLFSDRALSQFDATLNPNWKSHVEQRRKKFQLWLKCLVHVLPMILYAFIEEVRCD